MEIIPWRYGDSNPRPSHCERDALPTELYPQEALSYRRWALTQACLGSDFLGDGQSDQTEGHRPREEKFKSSLVEFVVEVGRGGELGDTTGEVAKGIALAAEELSDPRHEIKEV